MTFPKAFMLFGPTASGKTALAIQLAQRVNGVIINADSRQVYREMPILTAMPSAEEFAAAPHELFEILDPTEPFDAAAYALRAAPVAQAVVVAGKTPIFVGGTGFYLHALEKGLSPTPHVPPEIVQNLEQEPDVHVLHSQLRAVDPALADSLKSTDRQRIIRGLSVFLATQKPLSLWQQEKPTGALPFQFTKIALHPPREVVIQRINQRFDVMLEMGVLAEVEALQEKYGDIQALPSKTMHGLRELAGYLNGDLTLAEAQESLLAQTRQYAKRQVTWLRNSYAPDLVVETPNIAHLTKILAGDGAA